MTFLEVSKSEHEELTLRQRWSHYFVIIFALTSLAILINLRNNALNSTSLYINNAVGIRAVYPENWLLDEGTNYVFRVRNVQEIGFNTTFRVQVIPVGADTTQRSVIDTLAMNRAQTLAAYRILSIETFELGNDQLGNATTYTYVELNPDPFLESIPVVVQGIDIITINRGQAIIITMLSDSDQFSVNFSRFEQFVNQLEF